MMAKTTTAGQVRGRFSSKEDDFIRTNYMEMTDKQIADALHRKEKAIVNRRQKLGLMDKRKNNFVVPTPKKTRASYLSSLDEGERAEFHRKELRASSTHKQIKDVLYPQELQFYEDKYVSFMTDPTIETMTVMERDALHDMTMSQIRMTRFMKLEQTSETSYAREIKDCQDVIHKCQESLNVQRRQRLKNTNDQAVNFTALIKELKDPNVRREVGYEAAMLRYMAEKYYTTHMSRPNRQGNIIAGQDNPFDVGSSFVDGHEPSGLSGEFS